MKKTEKKEVKAKVELTKAELTKEELTVIANLLNGGNFGLSLADSNKIITPILAKVSKIIND